MSSVRSRITAQGQISVPAKIRQKLGLGPGSVIEWDDEGPEIVVRKAGRFTSEDLHSILFDATPDTVDVEGVKEGIRDHMRRKHARR